MTLTLRLFGRELLRVELTSGAADEASEETVAHRHAGEFGFGFSPSRPYWSHDPEEAPTVARAGRSPS